MCHINNGFDSSNCLHITLTHYDLLKPILDASPFNVDYLHYWKNKEEFIHKNIDYSKGFVKRTPENDPRNTDDNKYLVTSFVCDLTKKL